MLDQIWPCCKIGQGQPRDIIWTNLVVLEHPMLHTKFQSHRPSGFGDDFLRFLPYMGMAAILVMWPGSFEQTFVPPSQGGSIWNLASISPVVSEEMFENVDIHTTYIHTHIRTTEAYPTSSPVSLRLRWAKNGGNLGLVLKMKNIVCILILLTKYVKYTYLHLFKFVLYSIVA